MRITRHAPVCALLACLLSACGGESSNDGPLQLPGENNASQTTGESTGQTGDTSGNTSGQTGGNTGGQTGGNTGGNTTDETTVQTGEGCGELRIPITYSDGVERCTTMCFSPDDCAGEQGTSCQNYTAGLDLCLPKPPGFEGVIVDAQRVGSSWDFDVAAQPDGTIWAMWAESSTYDQYTAYFAPGRATPTDRTLLAIGYGEELSSRTRYITDIQLAADAQGVHALHDLSMFNQSGGSAAQRTTYSRLDRGEVDVIDTQVNVSNFTLKPAHDLTLSPSGQPIIARFDIGEVEMYIQRPGVDAAEWTIPSYSSATHSPQLVADTRGGFHIVTVEPSVNGSIHQYINAQRQETTSCRIVGKEGAPQAIRMALRPDTQDVVAFVPGVDGGTIAILNNPDGKACDTWQKTSFGTQNGFNHPLAGDIIFGKNGDVFIAGASAAGAQNDLLLRWYSASEGAWKGPLRVKAGANLDDDKHNTLRLIETPDGLLHIFYTSNPTSNTSGTSPLELHHIIMR